MRRVTSKAVLYPIRAASRLTGIPEDTLRAWERRHNAVQPKRSHQRRLYTEADIKRLVLLREAVERGHPIRDAARMSDTVLEGISGPVLVNTTRRRASKTADAQPYLAALDCIERYDGVTADHELSRLSWLMPPVEFVNRVALPLMRETGQRWHEGRFAIAQEHMVTAILRNILGTMVRLHQPARPSVTLLFATLPGERHDFGLLAAAMLTAASGLGVVYLGTEVPANEIVVAAKRTAAKAVVLCALNGAESLAEAKTLSGKLNGQAEVWIGSVAAKATGRPGGLRTLLDFPAFEAELGRIGGLPPDLRAVTR